MTLYLNVWSRRVIWAQLWQNRQNNDFSSPLVITSEENSSLKAQFDLYKNRLKIKFPHIFSCWLSPSPLVVGLLAQLQHRYPHSNPPKMLQNVPLVTVNVPFDFLSFKQRNRESDSSFSHVWLACCPCYWHTFRDRSFLMGWGVTMSVCIVLIK